MTKHRATINFHYDKYLFEYVTDSTSQLYNWYLTPVVILVKFGGPVSQIHSPHLQAGAPRIFSDLLKSVQMLMREWGRKEWEVTALIHP